MITNYILYFAIILSTLFTTFILGYFSIYLTTKIRSRNILNSFFVGFLVSITGYSLIITKFNTINIFLLFLFSVYVFVSLKNSTNNKEITKKEDVKYFTNQFLVIFILSIVFFLINLFTLISLKDLNFKGYFWDTYFYSRVSQYLNLGIENVLLENNYLLTDNKPLTLYHFAELWFAALIAKVFSIPTFPSYILIVFTYLQVLIFFGILNIFKHFKKIKLIDYIIIVALMHQFFIFKVVFVFLYEKTQIDFFNTFYHGLGVGLSMYQWYLPKGLIVFIPLLMIIDQLNKNNHLNVVFLTLVLAIINPVIGIAFSISYALLLIIKLRKKSVLFLLIYTTFGLLYISFFALKIQHHLDNESEQLILNSSYSLDQLILFSKILFSCLISLSLFIFLVGFKKFVSFLKNIKAFIFISLISSLIGLIINLLLIDYDSKQFWTYTLVPSLTLILIVFYIQAWINSKAIVKYGLFIFLFIIFAIGLNEKLKHKNKIVTKYGVEYQNIVLNNIPKTGTFFSGSLFNDSYYNNIHSTKSIYRTLGEFINFYRDNHVSFTLTDYKAKYTLQTLGVFQKSATIRYNNDAYFNNLTLKDTKKSIGNHQLQFILKNNIKFLFTQSDVKLEPEIKNHFKLIASDKLSGERFYIFINSSKL